MGFTTDIFACMDMVEESKAVDYELDEPFIKGHVVREFVVRLPDGQVFRSRACDDATRGVPEQELAARRQEAWAVSYGIAERAQRRAASQEESEKSEVLAL